MRVPPEILNEDEILYGFIALCVVLAFALPMFWAIGSILWTLLMW